MSERTPITPEGWEPVYGPVRSVPTVCLEFDNGRDQSPTGRHLEKGCVTVGNRVMAYWQAFGHSLGNGTIVGFERAVVDGAKVPKSGLTYPKGWIKAVIDYDYNRSSEVTGTHDGFVRWDYDRVILCPGRWDDETQEESVARWRASLVEQGKRLAA